MSTESFDLDAREWDDSHDEEYSFFTAYKKRSGKIEIEIIIEEHIQLIMERGFYIFYLPTKDHIFLKIAENIATEVIRNDISYDYRKYIKELPYHLGLVNRNMLLQCIDTRGDALFNPYILGKLMPAKPIVFNEDTWDSGYHYFENGYVKVTKDKIDFKPYSELNRIIYDYQIHKKAFNRDAKFEDAIYYKFLKNITGNQKDEAPKRLESLMTIIGYMLHRCTDKGQLISPILTDGRISEDEAAEGRSGKGMVSKGLKFMLNTDREATVHVDVSGKDWKLDNRFRWQKLRKNTKSVHLDDAKTNFNLQDLFTDIDSGIYAEEKNMKPELVVAKILITTNQTIRTAGGSARARVYEFELSDHYSEEYTPKDEFGHLFWLQWDEEEYQRFFMVMLECLRLYLEKGEIIRVEGLVLGERKLREETSIEFYDFMTEFINGKIDLYQYTDQALDKDCYFDYHKKINKKILLDCFCTHYRDFQKVRDNKATRFNKTFTKWLRTWCLHHEDFAKSSKAKDETKSGTNYYFIFRPSAKKLKEMEATKEAKNDQSNLPKASRK